MARAPAPPAVSSFGYTLSLEPVEVRVVASSGHVVVALLSRGGAAWGRTLAF